MVVLALDTTGAAGSLALLRGSDVLVEHPLEAGVPHGRRLPQEILTALERARMRLAEIELYVVASGPGAFTGLRVGIATMQGLAFAHGRPLIGVSALDALVHAVPERTAGLYAAWMDAARQEVFSALYEAAADGTIVTLDEPAVGAADTALSRWQPLISGRPLIFVGSGAVRYADRIAAAVGDRAQVVRPTPMIAVALGRLGLERAAAGEAGPPHAVRPLYVRRPDAELARERRVGELADRG